MDNLTLSFAGHSIDWAALPDSSKEALAALGFSTKIKNSIAGLKAAILQTSTNQKAWWSDEDCAEAADDYGIRALWDSEGRGDKFAEAVCEAVQGEMFDAIVKGIEPSARRGGKRLSDDEKLRRSIEIELLEKAAKAKGKTIPKRSKPDEKDAFEALLVRAREDAKFSAAVAKEFEKRKNAKAIDLDLEF